MDKQNISIIIIIILLVLGTVFFLFNKPKSTGTNEDTKTDITNIGEESKDESPFKELNAQQNAQQQAAQNQTPQQNNQVQNSNEETNMNKNYKQYSSPPEMTIDQKKAYSAVLYTSEGNITINLNVTETPVTANNFIFLAREGFYNNTVFHRVMENFMIQGGDPEGTGRGGPGYRFDNENFTGEYTRGAVAMANAGRDTNGSQFFIMHKDFNLPNDYVIFGSVSEGIDVVDKIATAEVAPSGSGEMSKPVNPVVVESVEIVEK